MLFCAIETYIRFIIDFSHKSIQIYIVREGLNSIRSKLLHKLFITSMHQIRFCALTHFASFILENLGVLESMVRHTCENGYSNKFFSEYESNSFIKTVIKQMLPNKKKINKT